MDDEGDLDVVAGGFGQRVKEADSARVGGSPDESASHVGPDGIDLGWLMAEADHLAEHEIDADALAFGDLEDRECVGERWVRRPGRVREQIGRGDTGGEPARRGHLNDCAGSDRDRDRGGLCPVPVGDRVGDCFTGDGDRDRLDRGTLDTGGGEQFDGQDGVEADEEFLEGDEERGVVGDPTDS